MSEDSALNDAADGIDERVRGLFERAWKQGQPQPQPIESFLSEIDPARVASTVEELVHIELELSWKKYRSGGAARPIPFEDYLARFPVLNRPPIVRRLAEQEYAVRSQCGDRPTAEEYRTRVSSLGIDASSIGRWTEPSPVEPTSPPGYQILGELGRGGMGIIYKARHLSLNRIVALKMIRADVPADAELLARFQAEAEAVARLQHPHIVQIHDVGLHQGRPFFSLELVEGKSLDKHLDGTPLPPRRIAELVLTLARAVDAIHQCGFVHRDLKPGNVLLTTQGEPKVSDFGLAKFFHSHEPEPPRPNGEEDGRTGSAVLLTKAGALVGTPCYMAPEQAASRADEIGPATDVYALGAMLYEMLTGRPPFRGTTVAETLDQILTMKLVHPRQLQPRVPRDLETVCLKCLRKSPGDRYTTAAELAADVRRFLDGMPVSARPVGPLERLRKRAARHPALAAVVCSAAVLASAAGFFAYQAHRAEKTLRAEKRQNVLEKALLAAMSGDFAAAAVAIGEAEKLGASAGELDMLRGMVAVYSGNGPEALTFLKSAVESTPDSVAAKALLGIAQKEAGQNDVGSDELLDRATRAAPYSATDYLFLGKLAAMQDPEHGLQFLGKAVERSKSPVVLLTRADALIYKATDTGGLSELETAKRDIQVAEVSLGPDSVLILIVKLRAELATADTYRRLGQAENATSALARAGEHFQALHQFPKSYEGFIHQCGYLLLSNRDGELLALCRDRAAAMSDHPLMPWWLALEEYRAGRIDAARQRMELSLQHLGNNFRWIYLGYVWSEFPDASSKTRRLFEKRSTDQGLHQLFLAPSIFFLTEEKGAVQQTYRQMRRQIALPKNMAPALRDWYDNLLGYLCGDATEEQLLSAASNSRWNLCEAHFYLGLTSLADRDFGKAKVHFRASVETNVYRFSEWIWSRLFLARMELDPGWPRWIPKAK